MNENMNEKKSMKCCNFIVISFIAIIASLLSLLLFSPGCIEERKSSDSGVSIIGKVISSKEGRRDEDTNTDKACENYSQIKYKYICQNHKIVDRIEECGVITTTTTTISSVISESEQQQSVNTFSVKRCLSGRCIEAKISKEFSFLTSECNVDEDCYDIICYKKTTTTTTTSTTTTTTTTYQDDCTILGCPPGTKYVGSKKTGKYYRCSSECGTQILDENRVCLMTEEQAKDYGFERCRVFF